jgi:hypothetical protein
MTGVSKVPFGAGADIREDGIADEIVLSKMQGTVRNLRAFEAWCSVKAGEVIQCCNCTSTPIANGKL